MGRKNIEINYIVKMKVSVYILSAQARSVLNYHSVTDLTYTT